MLRPVVASALLAVAGLTPLADEALGWGWVLDSPVSLLLAVVAGYAAGAWLPRAWCAVGVAVVTAALVVANQMHDDQYHWLDDLVFFLVAVAGPAVAGATVATRSRQVRRLGRLQAELEEQQRVAVAAARLDEKNKIWEEIHTRLAEQIAGIAIRAEGARRGEGGTALAAIEAEARSVLDRLRETLGSLRQDEPRAPVTAVSEDTASQWTRLDLLVPAVIGVALAVETAVIDDARGSVAANVVAALAVAAPLVARRRHPLVATAASSAAGVAMSAALTPIPETVTGVALLVVIFYSVGAWCRPRRWLLGAGIAAAGTVGMEVVSGVETGVREVGDAAIVLLWALVALAVGRVTAGWQERLRRTRAVVDALERGRGAAVRLAVAQQREALASELHDTVAHSMTVVCLQAAAHQRTGDEPDAALEVIAAVAEKSLAELRDGLEALETAGNPLDPSRITALGRRIGVDLRVSAEETGPGPAAALAHRVIREAVVNVARHAPGASAAVRVQSSGRHLSVEVVDDGSREEPALRGTGTGLCGLAETVQSLGGQLEWGHREPTGFRVAALIPREQP